MRLKSLLTVALAVALLSSFFAGSVAAYDSGDAVAIQTNDQSNENAQVGSAEAENSAEQEQEQEIEIDFGDGDNGPPTPPPTQA